MKRIEADDNGYDIGGGKLGFTNGMPPTIPGTLVQDYWLNGVQEELCNAIEAGGQVLSGADYFQLLKAIKRPHAVLANVTLVHGTDFTDFNEVLSRFDDRYIAEGVIVTISIASTASITITAPIKIKHPQGDRINIIGNVASPPSHKLVFNPATYPVDGAIFEIMPGGKIGKIDGIRIEQSAGTPNGRHYGIKVHRDAYAVLGNDLQIQSIAGTGVLIDGGNCDAKGTDFTGITSVGTPDDGVGDQQKSGFGIIVKNRGLLKAFQGSFTSCNMAGVLVTHGATAELFNCQAFAAQFLVSMGGICYAEDCTSLAVSSDAGFKAEHGSQLTVVDCESGSTGNPNSFGYSSLYGSSINGIGSTIAEHNTYDGFIATAGSRITGSNLTANSNGRYGGAAGKGCYVGNVVGISNGTALKEFSGNGTQMNRID